MVVWRNSDTPRPAAHCSGPAGQTPQRKITWNTPSQEKRLSLPEHREALAVHLRELGPQHVTTVATLANLAGTMMLEGRYTDAEKVYRRVLAAREKTLGPEHEIGRAHV